MPVPSPFNLSGRTALVTGANTGIGQGVAIGLATAGASIVLAGRSAMDETAAKLDAIGAKHISLLADLSTNAPLAGLVDDAVNWGKGLGAGGLDILVNNAGIIRRADAVDFTEADWDAVIDTNLKSAFFLSQAAAKHMIPRKSGKIIHIASLLSFQGGIRVASYTASKSGLAGLTRLMACEWAPLGLNVNAIAPGYFSTNNTEALRADEERNAAILGRIPAARWGQPDDLAGAAVFLASDAAAYVNGVVLPVDGGWLAR